MRIIVTSLVCLLLASCASYKLVEPATPVTVKGMQIQPRIAWNKAPHAPGNYVEVWTADGHQLNELILVGQVDEGTSLFELPNKELPMPAYKAGMLPNEMEDLVTTSLKNWYGGELDISTANLRPMDVAGQIGFRFNLDFYTKDGLAKRGDVVVVEKDNRFYSMILIGTKIHYYDSLAEEFEMMANSLII